MRSSFVSSPRPLAPKARQARRRGRERREQPGFGRPVRDRLGETRADADGRERGERRARRRVSALGRSQGRVAELAHRGEKQGLAQRDVVLAASLDGETRQVEHARAKHLRRGRVRVRHGGRACALRARRGYAGRLRRRREARHRATRLAEREARVRLKRHRAARARALEERARARARRGAERQRGLGRGRCRRRRKEARRVPARRRVQRRRRRRREERGGRAARHEPVGDGDGGSVGGAGGVGEGRPARGRAGARARVRLDERGARRKREGHERVRAPVIAPVLGRERRGDAPRERRRKFCRRGRLETLETLETRFALRDVLGEGHAERLPSSLGRDEVAVRGRARRARVRGPERGAARAGDAPRQREARRWRQRVFFGYGIHRRDGNERYRVGLSQELARELVPALAQRLARAARRRALLLQRRECARGVLLAQQAGPSGEEASSSARVGVE